METDHVLSFISASLEREHAAWNADIVGKDVWTQAERETRVLEAVVDEDDNECELEGEEMEQARALRLANEQTDEFFWPLTARMVDLLSILSAAVDVW